jgi:integrase
MATATAITQQSSVYIRRKDGAGNWYYDRIETGKGHKTGHLAGPFFSRPFTVNSKGKRAQVWNKLRAGDFEAAQAEANLGATALVARAQGLTVVEAEQITNGNRVLISDAVAKFLDQKRTKAYRTRINYTHILNEFLEWLPDRIRFVDQMNAETDNTLDNYMRHLETIGSAPRTIQNKISVVCFMLKKRRNFPAGIETPTKIVEMPTIDEEDAIPYKREELKKIFKVASPEERICYQFFLDSACREQEGSVAEWQDIDWTERTYYIHPKKWMSQSGKPKEFKVKTHETRYVPLTRELVDLLKARKADKKNPAHSRWIFPNKNGDPDGHLLRKFKKLVFKAGLNCGHCHKEEWGKDETCSTKLEGCETHYLHRLRKTCATFWHHQGIPIRNIQKYLGHKSLDTTQKYLGLKDNSEIQDQINAPKF